jgi:hypothetical protein
MLSFEHIVARIADAKQRPWMGGYTRPVSEQGLGKHVAIVRQQILNNATDFNGRDVSVVRTEIL